MADTSLNEAVEQYIRTIIRDEVGDGGDGGGDIDLDELATKVSERIEIDVDHPDQLGEDQVRAWIEEYPHRSDDELVALIDEHANGSGDDGGDGDGLTDNEREQLRALLDRIDGSLDTIDDELGLSMTIGPEVPDGHSAHNTPGWGQVMSVDEPVRFGECTIVCDYSGTFEAQLWTYENGDVQEKVDATELQTPSDGEYTVDLDLVAGESGQYLLTRDYDLDRDSAMDLWRPTDQYDYPESGELLTVHTAGHNEYSDSSYWYYYFDLTVEAHDPDGE